MVERKRERRRGRKGITKTNQTLNANILSVFAWIQMMLWLCVYLKWDQNETQSIKGCFLDWIELVLVWFGLERIVDNSISAKATAINGMNSSQGSMSMIQIVLFNYPCWCKWNKAKCSLYVRMYMYVYGLESGGISEDKEQSLCDIYLLCVRFLYYICVNFLDRMNERILWDTEQVDKHAACFSHWIVWYWIREKERERVRENG